MIRIVFLVLMLVLAPTGFWATWHFLLGARTVTVDMKRAVDYGSSRASAAPVASKETP